MAQERTPLVGNANRTRDGRASMRGAIGNIIISIVGTGVLGLPYTFKMGGWATASAAIILAGLLTYHCMMLLIRCRIELEQTGHLNICTYGDLGGHTHGKAGRYAAEIMVLVSQCGGCIAYMLFIGQNLSSVFTGSNDKYSYFIFAAVPIEIGLACVRSLSSLAPFSVFAEICNVIAMGIVMKDDLRVFSGFDRVMAFTDVGGSLFAVGVAVFSYEGFSMALSLEASMKNPNKFGRVLGLAFFVITAVYIGFGFCGYVAYGSDTRDIITLNLPNHWSTGALKISLCVAMLLTFPLTMHPAHEIFEQKLLETSWCQQHSLSSPMVLSFVLQASRGISVVILAILAASAPGFGVFVSLIGSTVSASIAFVFPTLFHLNIFSGSLSIHARALDIIVLVCGIAFALQGFFTAFLNVFSGPSESPSAAIC